MEKSRLVLSIIRNNDNKFKCSAEELIQTFDRSLQGSLVCCMRNQWCKTKLLDYERRFFCKRWWIIKTTTSDCLYALSGE